MHDGGSYVHRHRDAGRPVYRGRHAGEPAKRDKLSDSVGESRDEHDNVDSQSHNSPLHYTPKDQRRDEESEL